MNRIAGLPFLLIVWITLTLWSTLQWAVSFPLWILLRLAARPIINAFHKSSRAPLKRKFEN